MHTSLLTSLLLATPAFAQAPSFGTESPAPSPNGNSFQQIERDGLAALRDTVVFDTEADGTVWAGGRNWKASFGADGLEFIPFLGSDAPQNYPVRFDLSSVTVSGDPLMIADAPRASRVDREVTLGRSAVREVYHVGDDSVEQTFVFDSLPSSGELVLRIDVETELEAAAAGEGFAFDNARGGVRYGAATAISASGASIALEQQLVDGAIEIVVPADFVAASTFPLVVDPLIWTQAVTADSRDQVDVDVAYDAASGVYMLVYEEIQSGSDHDVRSIFYNTNVDLFLSPSSIDITSTTWFEPRIASAPVYSTFLTVATRGGVGSRRVWGRTRNANSGSVSTQLQLTFGTGEQFSADVGGFGDDFNTAYPFLVVFQKRELFATHSDILTQTVQEDGSLNGGTVAVATTLDDDRSPRISNSSGNNTIDIGDHEYLIAWERVVAPGDHEIWTRVVGYGGSTLNHDAWLTYSIAPAGDVAVSTQALIFDGTANVRAWVMAFERLRNGVNEIFTVVAEEGTTYPARSIPVMQDLDFGSDHADPRIAYDGTGDYFLSYLVEGGMGYDAYVTTVNVVRDLGNLRTGIADRRSAMSHPMGTATAVAIGTTYDGGLHQGTDSQGMALTTARGAGGDDEVSAAMYEEFSDTVEGSQFCDAAENASGRSAFIRASGSGYFAGGILDLRVYDLPMDAFGYAIASLNTGFTPNAGGGAGNLCLSGAIGRFNGQVQNSGAAGEASVALNLTMMPQPMGITSVMSGERWKFQYWTRDVQGGMATSNFSNGVVVHFD